MRDCSIPIEDTHNLLELSMQKPFTTQRDLLVSRSDLDHPIRHSLDDTERLLSSIYVSTTGRPDYPLLSLFRSLLLGVWYGLSDADRVRNAVIAVIRSGGERPFATYKQQYGLARTQFMDLTKNKTGYDLAAMAANIGKGAKFLKLYGLPS